ncbi:MAG: hypothetical protein ACTHK5_05760 [Tsuneonella sp.]
MILHRRQFLAGGAALWAASGARGQVPVATPEQFGAVGDLDGNRGTDDTLAFRRLGHWLSSTGGRALVTRRHRITVGFTLFGGTLSFADTGLIRNTIVRPRAPWDGTCLFAGTYFGVTGPGSLNGEAPLAIEPMAAGADRFRVRGGAVPPRFAVGALVYLKDGRRIPGAAHDFRLAAHIARIAAVDGDTVVLREPSPVAIGGGANALATALVASDALPLHPALGVPAPYTRMARGVRIENGAFESAANEVGKSQTVHIACADSAFDFRWLAGSACLGINPCSDTAITVRDAEFSSVLYELAYFHARVSGSAVRGRRIARGPAGGVPPVSITEYGHSVAIDQVDVTDLAVPGDHGRPTIAIATPLTTLGECRVAGASGAAASITAAAVGTRIGSLDIDGGRGNGLIVGADHVSIERARISARSNGVPVLLTAEAGADVRLGTLDLAPGESVRDLRRRQAAVAQ